MVLQGQIDAKVNNKSRVAFPQQFRKLLGKRVIVTYGFENSLIAVSEENWEELLQEIENTSFLASSTRELQRVLIGGVVSVEFDSQGRFVLPEYLRNFAQIGDEVVFIGQRKYVEIWDKKRWEEHRNALLKNFGSLAEKFVQKSMNNE